MFNGTDGRHDYQHNDIQYKDTQHTGLSPLNDTQQNVALPLMLSVVMLNLTF